MSLPGLVTSVSSRSYEVSVEGRGTVRCTLRGSLWERQDEDEDSRPVAVGDRVSVTLDGESGVIESIAERSNRLARPHGAGKRRRVQVIAANIDRLIVVTSLADPPFRAGLVDRFLVNREMADRWSALDSESWGSLRPAALIVGERISDAKSELGWKSMPFGGVAPSTVMTVEKPDKEAFNSHLTVKPVTLLKHLIELFTKPGQTVLDPFLGSGSTALAAFETGRSCIGIEINEKYARIARNRIRR